MSRAVAAAAVLFLLSATPAEAKTAFTPPLGPALGDFVTCMAQNVGTKTRSVRISIRASDGVELAAQTYDLAPGAVLAPVSESAWGSYCVFEGLSRTVRGFAAITHDNTTLLVVPAE
jgi:hypothetical protein